MKNQWLARKPIVVDWKNLPGNKFIDKLLVLHRLMHNQKLYLGGIVWVGPRIYDRFFDTLPTLTATNWIVEGTDALGDTIRIVFAINGVKMKKDIKVLNFPPEDACDS